MNLGWPGGSDNRSPRSAGRRSKNGRRDGGSVRNPLMVPETDEQNPELQPDTRRGSGHDPLTAMEIESPRESQADRRNYPRRANAASQAKTGRSRGPLGLSHILFLLAGLALGATLLVSTQHFYNAAGKPKRQQPPPAKTGPPAVSPPAVPAVKPQPQQATTPVQAIRLMIAAAAKNDTATAYAQWDVPPDEIATVKRGQELTVADVVSNGARHSDQLQPGKLAYRVLSQSQSEAQVGEYQGSVCQQIFSLRKRGPYWKLFNASAP